MTKKQWAARGNPCSIPECPWHVEWKVYDAERRLVRQWCAVHHDEYYAGALERNWTMERIEAQSERTDKKVDSLRPPSGGSADADHTSRNPAPPALKPGGPAGGTDERRLTLSPKGSNGPVRPAGHDAGHSPASLTAQAPPPAPSLSVWQGAGELTLTAEQQNIMWQAVDPEKVQIRPDGIVYLPWVVQWRVFLDAFSPYVPALIWLGNPLPEDGSVCLHIAMTVAGKFGGEAVGACKWRKNNPNMDWASAIEGAVSDGVTKLSKRWGMFQELWDLPWRNAWKAKYAMRVYRTQSGKWEWRRIEDEPFYDEGDPRKSSAGEYTKPRTFDDDAREHLASLKPDTDWPSE